MYKWKQQNEVEEIKDAIYGRKGVTQFHIIGIIVGRGEKLRERVKHKKDYIYI